MTASDRTARIWEAASGRQMLRLIGHADFVNSAAFSPDGTRIVTASWDDTARIHTSVWLSPFEQLLDLARSRVTRPLTREERRQFLGER